MKFKADSLEGLRDVREIVGKRIVRTIPFDKSAVDVEARTVHLAFSSETPVERYFGFEVLDHDPKNVDLSRVPGGVAFLLDHDTEKMVGVVDEVAIDADKVGRAVVRISKNRDDVLTDLHDGIRRNISFAYEITGILSETAAVDGEKPTLRFSWALLEISSVAVPADYTVGIGRSLESDDESRKDEAPVSEPTPPEGESTEAPVVEIVSQPEEPAHQFNTEKQSMEDLKNERERIAAIEDIAAKHLGRVNDMTSLRKKAVVDGLSAAEFRGLILENVTDSKPLETPKTEIGMSEKDVRKFSVANVIKAQMRNSKTDASFEREVSDEIAKRLGKPAQGFYIPFEVQRDWNIGQDAQGGALVAQEYRPQSFIEILRNSTVLGPLGVNYLPGLVGNVEIPKQDGTGTAYWVAEGNAPTESSGSTTQIALTPKTIGAFQDYTRLMMLQANPTIERIVRNDIVANLGLGVELAVFHGSGSGNQPKGIDKYTTVTSKSVAGFSFTSSTDLEGLIVNQNYAGAMNYVMRPQFRATLKSRVKESGQASYIVENNTMNGFPVLATNTLLSGHVFLGDFSNVWIGEWGTLDLTVDPYALSTSGGTRVIGLYNVDVALRYEQAFAFGYSAS